MWVITWVRLQGACLLLFFSFFPSPSWNYFKGSIQSNGFHHCIFIHMSTCIYLGGPFLAPFSFSLVFYSCLWLVAFLPFAFLLHAVNTRSYFPIPFLHSIFILPFPALSCLFQTVETVGRDSWIEHCPDYSCQRNWTHPIVQIGITLPNKNDETPLSLRYDFLSKLNTYLA